MTAALEVPALTLRALTDAKLADAWDAGQITWDQAATECDRRDRADRAAARARSARAVREQAWYEAAYAQYRAAEDEAHGNLLSPLALAEGISEPMVLWRGAEAWAMARASEELLAYWERCPRLTLAEWKRQLAAERHAERELAEPGPAALEVVTVRPVTLAAPAPVAPVTPTAPAAPVIPPMTPGSIARYTRALACLAEHADTLAAAILARRDQLRRAA